MKLHCELHEAIETIGAGRVCGRAPPGTRPGKRPVPSKRQTVRTRLGGRSAAEYCIDSGVKGALVNLLETFFGDVWDDLKAEVASARDGREVWKIVFKHFPGQVQEAGGVLRVNEDRDWAGPDKAPCGHDSCAVDGEGPGEAGEESGAKADGVRSPEGGRGDQGGRKEISQLTRSPDSDVRRLPQGGLSELAVTGHTAEGAGGSPSHDPANDGAGGELGAGEERAHERDPAAVPGTDDSRECTDEECRQGQDPVLSPGPEVAREDSRERSLEQVQGEDPAVSPGPEVAQECSSERSGGTGWEAAGSEGGVTQRSPAREERVIESWERELVGDPPDWGPSLSCLAPMVDSPGGSSEGLEEQRGAQGVGWGTAGPKDGITQHLLVSESERGMGWETAGLSGGATQQRPLKDGQEKMSVPEEGLTFPLDAEESWMKDRGGGTVETDEDQGAEVGKPYPSCASSVKWWSAHDVGDARSIEDHGDRHDSAEPRESSHGSRDVSREQRDSEDSRSIEDHGRPTPEVEEANRQDHPRSEDPRHREDHGRPIPTVKETSRARQDADDTRLMEDHGRYCCANDHLGPGDSRYRENHENVSPIKALVARSQRSRSSSGRPPELDLAQEELHRHVTRALECSGANGVEGYDATSGPYEFLFFLEARGADLVHYVRWKETRWQHWSKILLGLVCLSLGPQTVSPEDSTTNLSRAHLHLKQSKTPIRNLLQVGMQGLPGVGYSDGALRVTTPEGVWSGQAVKHRPSTSGDTDVLACRVGLHCPAWPEKSAQRRLVVGRGEGILRRLEHQNDERDPDTTLAISWLSHKLLRQPEEPRRWRRHVFARGLTSRTALRRLREEPPPRTLNIALEPSYEATASSEMLVVGDLRTEPAQEKVVDRRTCEEWPGVTVTLARELQLNRKGARPWRMKSGPTNWPSNDEIWEKHCNSTTPRFFPDVPSSGAAETTNDPVTDELRGQDHGVDGVQTAAEVSDESAKEQISVGNVRVATTEGV